MAHGVDALRESVLGERVEIESPSNMISDGVELGAGEGGAEVEGEGGSNHEEHSSPQRYEQEKFLASALEAMRKAEANRTQRDIDAISQTLALIPLVKETMNDAQRNEMARFIFPLEISSGESVSQLELAGYCTTLVLEGEIVVHRFPRGKVRRKSEASKSATSNKSYSPRQSRWTKPEIPQPLRFKPTDVLDVRPRNDTPTSTSAFSMGPPMAVNLARLLRIDGEAMQRAKRDARVRDRRWKVDLFCRLPHFQLSALDELHKLADISKRLAFSQDEVIGRSSDLIIIFKGRVSLWKSGILVEHKGPMTVVDYKLAKTRSHRPFDCVGAEAGEFLAISTPEASAILTGRTQRMLRKYSVNACEPSEVKQALRAKAHLASYEQNFRRKLVMSSTDVRCQKKATTESVEPHLPRLPQQTSTRESRTSSVKGSPRQGGDRRFSSVTNATPVTRASKEEDQHLSTSHQSRVELEDVLSQSWEPILDSACVYVRLPLAHPAEVDRVFRKWMFLPTASGACYLQVHRWSCDKMLFFVEPYSSDLRTVARDVLSLARYLKAKLVETWHEIHSEGQDLRFASHGYQEVTTTGAPNLSCVYILTNRDFIKALNRVHSALAQFVEAGITVFEGWSSILRAGDSFLKSVDGPASREAFALSDIDRPGFFCTEGIAHRLQHEYEFRELSHDGMQVYEATASLSLNDDSFEHDASLTF